MERKKEKGHQHDLGHRSVLHSKMYLIKLDQDWPRHAEASLGLFGQRRPKATFTSAQSGQGLQYPFT